MLKIFGLEHLKASRKMLRGAVKLLLQSNNYIKDGELEVSRDYIANQYLLTLSNSTTR